MAEWRGGDPGAAPRVEKKGKGAGGGHPPRHLAPALWAVPGHVLVTMFSTNVTIYHHLIVTTFLFAEVAHLQQNNLVSTEWHCGQWEIFFGLSSGPLLTVLPEHMWQHMD